MTRDETKAILSVIAANFPAFYKGRAADAMKLQLDTWAAMFGNEPYSDVQSALAESLKVCTYPPSAADIFKQLRARRAEALPSEAKQWDAARKAAREISKNLYYAQTGGFCGPSGRLTPRDLYARNQDIFAALPPAVQSWAGSPLDLSELFDREDSELNTFVRPAFRKAIETQQAQAVAQIERIPAAERPAMALLGY